MAGFVKRGKSWAYVVQLGRDPATGKYRQQWRSGFPTKKAAQEAYEAEQVARRRGEHVEPSGVTVGEFLTLRWLPSVEARVKPATYDFYRVSVEAQIVPRIGSIRLQDLDGAALSALYRGLLKDGRRDGRGGLAPKTVRNVGTLMHTALRDAVRQRLIPRNPADDADKPKVEDREMAYWTPEQLRAFLESVGDDRLAAMWLLFCTTGMRRGEVLGLRWADVDLEGRRLSVRQSLTTYGGTKRFGTPKSGKGRRLSLDEATITALRAHAARQADEITNWGPAWEDTGLVFVREDGAALDPAFVSRRFDSLVKASELPRIRLHDLRHSYAVAALTAGVHPKIVSERLGHSKVQITLDRYSHVIPGLDEAAAEQVAGVILGQ